MREKIILVGFIFLISFNLVNAEVANEDLILKETANSYYASFIKGAHLDIECGRDEICAHAGKYTRPMSAWLYLGTSVLAKKNLLEKSIPEQFFNEYWSGTLNTAHTHNLFQLLYLEELSSSPSKDKIKKLDRIVSAFLANLKQPYHYVNQRAMTSATKVAIIGLSIKWYKNIFEANKLSSFEFINSAIRYFNLKKQSKARDKSPCWEALMYHYIARVRSKNLNEMKAKKILESTFKDNSSYKYLMNQDLMACMHVAKQTNKKIYKNIVNELSKNRFSKSECFPKTDKLIFIIPKTYRNGKSICYRNGFSIADNSWLIANLS